MSEVYRIGVAMMLQDGMSPVLSKISSSLIGVHKSVDEIGKGFNRWKVGLMGAASVMAGTGILRGMTKVAEHGKELLDQQDKLIRQGRTQSEVAEITAAAYEKIAKAVPTATGAEVLKTVGELTMVLGDPHHALKASPYSLKLEALLGNATGRKADGEGYNFWRAVEERGGTQLPEAQRDKMMGDMLAGSIASGGKVGGRDWFTFAKRAGTSWMNMDEKMMGVIPTLIQSIGADTAGTSYMSATQTLLGAQTMTKQQVKAFNDLGLLDMSKAKNDHGRWSLEPAAIKGSTEHGNNLYALATEVLLPALQRVPEKDRQAIMAKLFPNRNSQRMMTMLTNPLTRGQIEKDLERQKEALPLGKAYENYTSNNPKGVEAAFHQQYESMMGAIGAPLMQAAIPVMRSITEVFSKIGELANANPGAVKVIAEGIAALGVALTVGGGVALMAALGPAGWIAAGLVALGAALMTVPWKSLWESLGSAISAVADKIAAAISAITKAFGSFNFGFGGGSGPAPGNGTGGRPGVAPGRQGYNAVPPSGGGSAPTKLSMIVDGRVLGEVVTRRQADAMNGPLNGSALFDGSAAFIPADFSYARG